LGILSRLRRLGGVAESESFVDKAVDVCKCPLLCFFGFRVVVELGEGTEADIVDDVDAGAISQLVSTRVLILMSSSKHRRYS
jgi:hypothetical protein